MTRSRTGSLPVAPTASTPSEIKKSYRPILLSPTLLSDWKVHAKRELIFEKSINVEELTEKCNIISLLTNQELFYSLQNISPYSPWLTAEFYTKLTMEIFIRDKWFPFSPKEINTYVRRSVHENSVDPSPNLLAAALTHNGVISWPNAGLKAQQLTTVYSVLLRIATANWIPTVHTNFVSEKLALLLYKVRNNLAFVLGEIIFSHLKTFLTKKKESKVHLPFPSLIYGMVKLHGFQPYTDEVISENSNIYVFYERLAQGHHYYDRATLIIPSAPIALLDITSVPVSTSSTVLKEPTTLLDRRQLVATILTSLAHLRSSVASQQATITELEVILENQTQEITRLENIHTRIIAACSARGPTSSASEEDCWSR
ncbi:uncharacterized protein LOC116013140 [Ipomoea triloba]|uniref:uncharacterized protein LOC116013140 n=1 Tax=Ipomoea triloba TaxID=35885 RepID=UPI00125CEF0C|nr:uncharacterized protein LOC116013140 [Ipomoea triloba]